jgi:GMP synthase-like glutamine amidotransferase
MLRKILAVSLSISRQNAIPKTISRPIFSVAILNCNALEKANFYAKSIQSWVSQAISRSPGSQNQDVVFVEYAVPKQELPPLRFHAYIGSGSPTNVTKKETIPWVKAYLSWIQAFHLEHKSQGLGGVPKRESPLGSFFGICFSHQAVATALGGQVADNPEDKWGLGIRQITLATPDRRGSESSPRPLSLAAFHHQQVTRPPSCSETLGKSDFCAYDILKYKGHFLTFQTHPEKQVVAEVAEAMGRLYSRTALPTFIEGLDSLSYPLDQKTETPASRLLTIQGDESFGQGPVTGSAIVGKIMIEFFLRGLVNAF